MATATVTKKDRTMTTILEPIGDVLVYGKVRIYFAKVNKTIADRLLAKRNGQNRTIIRAQVARLVREMEAGHFRTIHQGIAFDCNGDGIDFQHRLTAISKTNTEHVMMVSEGWDSICRVLIDAGKARSLRDNFKMMGVTERAEATASVLMHIRRHVDSSTAKLGFEDAKDLRNRTYKVGFDWMDEHVSADRGRRHAGMVLVAAFVYAMPRIGTDLATSAWTDLQEGAGLRATDPILKLRDEASRPTAQITAEARGILFRKALNALYMRLRGESTKQLKESDTAYAFFAEAYR